MNEDQKSMGPAEEKEILKEIMNMAFGKAAADLAEVVDLFVNLSVPKVDMLSAEDFKEYITTKVADYKAVDIVKQNFWGKFQGRAYLVFSAGAGKKLVMLVQKEPSTSFVSETLDSIGKETLIEVGNMVIGACVGKLTELLGDIVTYTQPEVIIDDTTNGLVFTEKMGPNDTAVLLNARFDFENENVTGFLLLVVSGDSIQWLKKALSEFISKFQ